MAVAIYFMFMRDNNKKTEEDKIEKDKTAPRAKIEIGDFVVVKDLAEKMGISATELISELIKNGVFASVNEEIDFETASIIADDFGFKISKRETLAQKLRKQRKKLSKGAAKRPPIVVMMGHVDHGKTSLLDKIRKTSVTASESGGITQHISAYQISRKGKLITFLDTPGHETFQAMRQRGAYLTDLAILVVAADDGVKPQTKEAINFIRQAEIPIIVALNKIDKQEANPEKTKKELSELDLTPEEWGGKTVYVETSAKTGQGINELLEMILLASEIEELKADLQMPAEGIVMESSMNSRRGAIANVIIQNGTLKEGDYISAGFVSGKVKRMEDFQGKKINKALPSMPVTIIGLENVPVAGSFLLKEKNKAAAEKRVEEFKKISGDKRLREIGISAPKIKELVKSEETKKFNIILRADTNGSLEAIAQTIKALPTEEVSIQIIKMGLGNITESDIKMAETSNVKVIGFHTNLESAVKRLAEQNKVKVKLYEVIYELIKDIKKDVSAMMGSEIIRTDLGKLKVIAIFMTGKMSPKGIIKMIVGARVDSGKIEKDCLLEIFRDGEKIGSGKVVQLEYNKKAVSEVGENNNAGITYQGDVKIELKDELVSYKEEERVRNI